ncbi:PqiC family protein [Castellaniella sp. WN]
MKRTNLARAGLLIGLAGLLAGCASAPERYYSLTAPAAKQPETAAVPAAAGYGLNLTVSRIPAESERPQLVVRDPATDPAVRVLNDSLWAASLGDQIRDVLAGEVGRRLGAADLRRLPDAASRPVRRIEVRIDRFDMVRGRFAALDADWTDRPPGADRARLCRASVRQPAGEGVASLVEAQRRALERLGALIAGAPADASVDLQRGSTVSKFGCT